MATAGPWESLRGVKLHAKLIEVLSKQFKFPTMTPVQSAAIPPILTSKDVCVEAETGSGKTLSFLLPIAQQLLFNKAKPDEGDMSRRSVRAIVLEPTRELALQVHTVASNLLEHLPGNVVPVPLIGGASAADGPGPDSCYSRDHRLIIATPGRLCAAMCANAINYSELDVLIMDEADRLLDMGFSVTLTDILTRLPKQRRTGMYSATQTNEVEALARAGLRNPVRVVVRVQGRQGSDVNAEGTAKRARIPSSVKCFYRTVAPGHRLAAIMQLLVDNPSAKLIVYFLTCACVEYFRRLPLSEMLRSTGELMNDRPQSSLPLRTFIALHGKMTQQKRERNLSRFSASESGVLLCTDVAARGIDIADVDWVVQFDLPQDPDAYIHRVGRTGRLGRDGKAMVLVGNWEESYIEFLRVRKCEVAEFVPSIQATAAEDEVRNAMTKLMREATLGDRAILEASEKAFLSYIRAYKEHKCRYLLKVADVDINSVGDAFGLLRLPRFHEYKKLRDKIEHRNTEGITIRDIGFKDRRREEQRQEDIREAVANRAERRAELQARSKNKKRKRKSTNRNNQQDGGTTGKNRAVGGVDGGEEGDADDFSFEAMQLRRVKRGKLSQVDFDKLTGYDDVE